MNPKVNGQLQKEWGWLIAAYLFLGGVGAGAYTIAAINSFMGESLEPSTVVGLWIGFPALVIVAPDGQIHSVHVGLTTAQELEEQVAAVAAEATPAGGEAS